MRVIIFGGRDFSDYPYLEYCLSKTNFDIKTVVCGGARGADKFGRFWAKERDIPVALFEADWKLHGKVAGIWRNQKMGDYADAGIAFWDQESKGTKHMIDYLKSLNKPIEVNVY